MSCQSPYHDIVILPTYLFGNKPLDPSLDAIDTSLVIGDGRVQHPLRLEHSIMLADLSEISNIEARKALIYGASLGSLPYNMGLEGILRGDQDFVDEVGAKVIYPWTSNRFGVSAKMLNQATAIEIHISGTLLPSFKPMQEGGSSGPSMHMDMESPKDLKKHVDMLKEISDYNIPIILNIGAGNVYGDVKLAAKAGADAIVIDTNLLSHPHLKDLLGQDMGMPVLGIIPPALKAMKETNAKEENIKVLISGGSLSGMDVFKSLAMGMDGVCLGRNFLIRAFQGQGHPTTEEGKNDVTVEIPDNINWKQAGENVAMNIRGLTEQVGYLFAITANASKKTLTSECLRATTYDAASLTGLKLAGYEKALPIWMH